MSGQFHAMANLTPRNTSPTSTEQGAGWAPRPIWMFWRKQKFLVPAQNWPQFLHCPAASPVTIPIHLSWLLRNMVNINKNLNLLAFLP